MHIGIVIAWRKRYRAAGDVAKKLRQPINKKIAPEKLIEYVHEHLDAYLKEIAEVFGFCPSSVLKRPHKLGITRKKRVLFTKSKIPKRSSIFVRKLKTFLKKSSYMSIKPA